MSKHRNNENLDLNIIEALNKLPLKMKNKDGNIVILRNIANTRESGKKHIANKTHGLQVKDIDLIPLIISKFF